LAFKLFLCATFHEYFVKISRQPLEAEGTSGNGETPGWTEQYIHSELFLSQLYKIIAYFRIKSAIFASMRT
jgi:hypothetical protein